MLSVGLYSALPLYLSAFFSYIGNALLYFSTVQSRKIPTHLTLIAYLGPTSGDICMFFIEHLRAHLLVEVFCAHTTSLLGLLMKRDSHPLLIDSGYTIVASCRHTPIASCLVPLVWAVWSQVELLTSFTQAYLASRLSALALILSSILDPAPLP